MSKYIFVQGFDFGTTTAQIQAHCSHVGHVMSIDMCQPGSCVVGFDTFEAAETAVGALNGSVIDGNARYIDVKIEHGRRPPSSTEQAMSTDGADTRVAIIGFDFGTTEKQIKTHCAAVGTVLSVEMMGRGECIVQFDSLESVQAAIADLNQTTIAGNRRYIDVRQDFAQIGMGFTPVATGVPVATSSNCVVIEGFDFGTMEQQIKTHCAAVGRVLSVEMLGRGECIIQFASPESAQAAIAKLNKTTIHGNHRYINVMDATEAARFMQCHQAPAMNPATPANAASAQVAIVGFDFGTTEDQIQTHCSVVGTILSVEMMGRGECVVKFDSPDAAQAAMLHLNKTIIAGNRRYIDVRDASAAQLRQRQQRPAMVQQAKPVCGTNAQVFVVGFDFGTTEEQIWKHCARVGSVFSVEMLGRGECVVQFGSPDSAQAAIAQLDKTTIAGNSRYIDVKLDLPQLGVSSVPSTLSSKHVLIEGFDFGTLEHQVQEHCESIGKVLSVEMFGRGECIVQFASPASAQAAIANLDKTTLHGNRRYINVVDATEAATTGRATWMTSMASPASAMMRKRPAPATSQSWPVAKVSRVATGQIVVRGFDFGTTPDQLVDHMQQVGSVIEAVFLDAGSAAVVYSTQSEANNAVVRLHKTVIHGNRRYIDVVGQ